MIDFLKRWSSVLLKIAFAFVLYLLYSFFYSNNKPKINELKNDIEKKKETIKHLDKKLKELDKTDEKELEKIENIKLLKLNLSERIHKEERELEELKKSNPISSLDDAIKYVNSRYKKG